MEFDYGYQERTEDFDSFMSMWELTSGVNTEDLWLPENNGMAFDERDRFLTFLPMVKFEIEQKFLTQWAHDELEGYYEAYSNGEFEGIFSESDLKDFEKDFIWCYEHRDDFPLEKGPGTSYYKLYGMKPKLNTTIGFTNLEYHVLKKVIPNLDELFEKNDLRVLLNTIKKISMGRTDSDDPSRQELEHIANELQCYDMWYK